MATTRRKVGASSPPNMNIEQYEQDTNDKRSRGQLKWKKLARCIRFMQYILKVVTSTTCSFVAIALILGSFFLSYDDEIQSTLMQIGMGYLFVARPILSTFAITCCDINLGVKEGSKKSKSVYKKEGLMTRIIALAFLLSIVCNQFPKWLSALVACCAVFAFGLASRQLVSQSATTKSHNNKMANKDDCSNPLQRIWLRLGLKERAALGGIAVVASLLIENFIIWVVSATYQPGIVGSPKPLQDNGRIVLEKLAMRIFNVNAPWMAKRTLQKLRGALNVQWALVSSFGASLVSLELQLGETTHRTLAGLALRSLMTLASARIIRTISFALTVLPSQVSNCYASHFPPPPEDWGEWLMVGFLPQVRGGCNDLILSGHATVTSTIGCAFTSAAANTSFSIAVWTLIALDYSIESYQGLHYSVDMWLGCIVTCLLWQLTKSLELSGEQEQTPPTADAKNCNAKLQSTLDAKVVGLYALPAILAFIVLTMVPEAYINYFVVGFSIWAGVLFAKCGFTNFLQHVLMCELCFALGAYL